MQYLKTGVSDEVDFLHAGKHESLLQIDTMILTGREWSSIPKVPFECHSFFCVFYDAKHKGMCATFQKKVKKGQYLKIWAKMYKI